MLLHHADELSGTMQPLYAIGASAGRQKEAVVNCALRACEMLFQRGELNSSGATATKAAARDEEDEDSFFDRTGDIERKKEVGFTHTHTHTHTLTHTHTHTHTHIRLLPFLRRACGDRAGTLQQRRSSH